VKLTNKIKSRGKKKSTSLMGAKAMYELIDLKRDELISVINPSPLSLCYPLVFLPM
jgi:hypothetical protein